VFLLRGRTVHTDDLLEVTPCYAVVVFVSRGEDFTVDGC
jgi:hypothetical protein